MLNKKSTKRTNGFRELYANRPKRVGDGPLPKRPSFLNRDAMELNAMVFQVRDTQRLIDHQHRRTVAIPAYKLRYPPVVWEQPCRALTVYNDPERSLTIIPG